MKHSTGKPTASEVERFEKLQILGCICCRQLKVNGRSGEVHHLLSGNKRRGHEYTILLCAYHHRSVTSLPKAKAIEEYGPSLADGSKPFHARFGDDQFLLDKTNELLRCL
jgi:Recombination enhancement, RecA-dependent nuclease